MSTDTNNPKPNSSKPKVHFGPHAEEGLKLYAKEIATYLRELPRLLKERHKGRHALIKGDEILSIWDTEGDAIQAGCEKFGLEPIFVKQIDPRDIQRFALLNLGKDSKCP
jgi:hypothetical protein